MIKFLSGLDFQLLLLQGTIMYSGNLRERSSTIDLIITTNRLFSKCLIYYIPETEYRSDYLTLSCTQFQVDFLKVIIAQRNSIKMQIRRL